MAFFYALKAQPHAARHHRPGFGERVARFGRLARGAAHIAMPKVARILPGYQGRHLGELRYGDQAQHRFADADKIREGARRHELEEIQRILNADFSVSHEMRRHYNDLRMLFFEGVASGKVRSFENFKYYIMEKGAEISQANPQLGQLWIRNAGAYADQLRKTFNRAQQAAMQRHFGNLSTIALGGDPHD